MIGNIPNRKDRNARVVVSWLQCPKAATRGLNCITPLDYHLNDEMGRLLRWSDCTFVPQCDSEEGGELVRFCGWDVTCRRKNTYVHRTDSSQWGQLPPTVFLSPCYYFDRPSSSTPPNPSHFMPVSPTWCHHRHLSLLHQFVDCCRVPASLLKWGCVCMWCTVIAVLPFPNAEWHLANLKCSVNMCM